MQVFYLNEERRYLVFGRMDVTEQYEKDAAGKRALEEAAAKAERANAAKSDFLARMSHDIRTPLNGILGMTELALEEPVSPAVEDYLRKVRESGVFLLSLVNDILDMSKVESGKMELHPEHYSYEELGKYLKAVINPLCDAKQIEFKVINGFTKYTVLADKLRLNQILFNLLSNAVKFSPRGGTVELEFAHHQIKDSHLELDILIRDHGNWGCSFHLPDGTYISAASQGNQIEVYDKTDKKKKTTWVSPNDSCLTQGSRCLFRVSTDWHGLECRVRELKLLGSSTEEVADYKLKASTGGRVDTAKLLDRDATTVEELDASPSEDEPLVLELTLKSPAALRAVDIKIEKGHNRLIIEAYKGGKWIPIHWGSLGASTAGVSDAQKAMYANEPEVLRMLQLPGNGFIKCMRTFDPVTTNRLRVKLFQKGGKVRLAELHVYKANAAKNMALRS